MRCRPGSRLSTTWSFLSGTDAAKIVGDETLAGKISRTRRTSGLWNLEDIANVHVIDWILFCSFSGLGICRLSLNRQFVLHTLILLLCSPGRGGEPGYWAPDTSLIDRSSINGKRWTLSFLPGPSGFRDTAAWAAAQGNEEPTSFLTFDPPPSKSSEVRLPRVHFTLQAMITKLL